MRGIASFSRIHDRHAAGQAYAQCTHIHTSATALVMFDAIVDFRPAGPPLSYYQQGALATSGSHVLLAGARGRPKGVRMLSTEEQRNTDARIVSRS